MDARLIALRREWERTRDPQDAAAYLAAVERAGFVLGPRPGEEYFAAPVSLSHTGNNQVVLTIPRMGHVLFSYGTPVAAIIGDETWYSSQATYSRTSAGHITRWLRSHRREPDDARDVPPHMLEDLLRLVPAEGFWP